MSKDTGIAQSIINSWKNNKYPTIDKLEKICQYLNISADVLLGINYQTYFTEKNILINQYRNLTKDDQEEIEQIIEMKLNKIKTTKKGLRQWRHFIHNA